MESGFVLVSGLNPDIVITPADVQLGEVASSAEFGDKLRDKRKWILIFHSHGIERAIVLHQAERSILLLDEEDQGSHQRFQWSNSTTSEVFTEKGVELFHFHR